MTEWEQLKSKYNEIPIPSDGPHQMLKAMAEAKRRRNRWKRVAQYGTVAAAALLVLVLLPRMLPFSGGSDTMNESASLKADYAAESIGSDAWFDKDSIADEAMMPETENALSPELATGRVTGYGEDSATTGAATEETEEQNVYFDSEEVSREIIRQMEKRMLETGETYYMKSEEYPEGFAELAEEPEYYVNEDGLLVIVFEAGVVAPKEQGRIEFVIPAEVVLP